VDRGPPDGGRRQTRSGVTRPYNAPAFRRTTRRTRRWRIIPTTGQLRRTKPPELRRHVGASDDRGPHRLPVAQYDDPLAIARANGERPRFARLWPHRGAGPSFATWVANRRRSRHGRTWRDRVGFLAAATSNDAIKGRFLRKGRIAVRRNALPPGIATGRSAAASC
jgi:hypothetical protein